MIKIIAVAIICGVIIIYLKSVNSELTLLAIIGSGIIISFFLLDYLIQAIDFFSYLIDVSGVDSQIFKIIFKITAIAYLVEFGADTLIDMGLKSIADKLVFAGKIIIFITAMPIIYSIFNLLIGMLQ